METNVSNVNLILMLNEKNPSGELLEKFYIKEIVHGCKEKSRDFVLCFTTINTGRLSVSWYDRGHNFLLVIRRTFFW